MYNFAAMILLVIGALNWLFIGVARFNFVEFIFGNNIVARVIYIIVGLAAVFMMFNRDFYLPFLGKTALPCSAFSDRIPPGATRTIKLSLAPGTKVVYWAAEPAMDEMKDVRDWKGAYARFENAGVATAGEDGIVYLKIREPQAYSVPMFGGLMKKKLEPHLHYRVCDGNGLLSRVETIYMSIQGNVEGFDAEGGADVGDAEDNNELMRLLKELDKYAITSGAMQA